MLTENQNNIVVSLTTFNIESFSSLKIEENNDSSFCLVTPGHVSPQPQVDSPHSSISNTVSLPSHYRVYTT